MAEALQAYNPVETVSPTILIDPLDLSRRSLIKLVEDMPDSAIETEPAVEQESKKPLTPEQISIIEQFMPLVEGMAVRMIIDRNPHEIEEAISDGYVGLVKAVKYYDPNKVPEDSTTGTSYFFSSIRGEILRGMRSRYGRTYDKKDAHGNVIEKGRVARLKPSPMLGTASSFDSPVYSSPESKTLGETIPDSRLNGDTLESQLLMADITKILEKFSERNQQIFNKYTFEGYRQQELAEVFGVSQIHVSRIVRKIREALRLQFEA